MLVKLKYLFKERVEFTKNTSIPCYSVTKKGIIPQLDTIAKTRKIENRKIIYPNDYIFNSRSSRFGSSGLKRIDTTTFLNTVISYPSFLEQQELCTFLDHKMTLLTKLQSHYTSLKVHLEEYQASLLYETFQHLS